MILMLDIRESSYLLSNGQLLRFKSICRNPVLTPDKHEITTQIQRN